MECVSCIGVSLRRLILKLDHFVTEQFNSSSIEWHQLNWFEVIARSKCCKWETNAYLMSRVLRHTVAFNYLASFISRVSFFLATPGGNNNNNNNKYCNMLIHTRVYNTNTTTSTSQSTHFTLRLNAFTILLRLFLKLQNPFIFFIY